MADKAKTKDQRLITNDQRQVFLKYNIILIFVVMHNHLKNELHHIISGKGKVRFGATIQTITSYLSDGTQSSSENQDTKQIREQETKSLEEFITKNKLWINDIDFSKYISEGAEQRVFLSDSGHVFKLNDAIYYSFWIDYFHNLLLHNFFFPDTVFFITDDFWVPQ